MAFTNPQGRTQTSLAEINIVPLVDVVLVLLIIFMLTAPIIQSGIEINVPKTRYGQRTHPGTIGGFHQSCPGALCRQHEGEY